MNPKTFSRPVRLLVTLLFGMFAAALLAFCAAPPNPPPPPITQDSITSVDSFAAPVLGIVVNRNLKIIQVEPQSAADKGGLKVGDILKMINSIELIHPSNALRAFHARELTEKTTMVILRDGKEITLEIVPGPAVYPHAPLTATPVPPEMTYF